MAFKIRKYRQRQTQPVTWKVARRCIFFFTTVCIIPVVLVLLVTTDQYVRPMSRNKLVFRPNMEPYEELSDVEKANITVIEKRLLDRKKYLKMACRRTGLDVEKNDSLHKPNPWEFLINTEYHLVWCNVFKAASTSWMYNFNLLAGYSPIFLKRTKIVPLSLARRKYSRPSLETLKSALNNSISFIIVRHPFERLLSAYRDKFQFSLPNTYHRKLGNIIIATYRTPNNDGLSQRKYPTFSEFVMFVIDSVKYRHALDMHWTPMTDFCTPCMFQLDVIAHIETLQEDQEYIIYKAKLPRIIKPQWKNPGRRTQSHIKPYYSQLTRVQILKLYHIYRYDFMLFNYSINGYLEMAQPETEQLLPTVEDYEDIKAADWLNSALSFLEEQNKFNNISNTNSTL